MSLSTRQYRVDIKPYPNYLMRIQSKKNITVAILTLQRLNAPLDIAREIAYWLIDYTNILRINMNILVSNLACRELHIVWIGDDGSRYEIRAKLQNDLIERETFYLASVIKISDFEIKRNKAKFYLVEESDIPRIQRIYTYTPHHGIGKSIGVISINCGNTEHSFNVISFIYD